MKIIKKHNVPFENHETHENFTIPCENNEIDENLKKYKGYSWKSWKS